jgi:hypothetical protein
VLSGQIREKLGRLFDESFEFAPTEKAIAQSNDRRDVYHDVDCNGFPPALVGVRQAAGLEHEPDPPRRLFACKGRRAAFARRQDEVTKTVAAIHRGYKIRANDTWMVPYLTR